MRLAIFSFIYLAFILSLNRFGTDGNLFPFSSWDLYSPLAGTDVTADLKIEDTAGRTFWNSTGLPPELDRTKLWFLVQMATGEVRNRGCEAGLEPVHTGQIVQELSKPGSTVKRAEVVLIQSRLPEYVFGGFETASKLSCKVIYER